MITPNDMRLIVWALPTTINPLEMGRKEAQSLGLCLLPHSLNLIAKGDVDGFREKVEAAGRGIMTHAQNILPEWMLKIIEAKKIFSSGDGTVEEQDARFREELSKIKPTIPENGLALAKQWEWLILGCSVEDLELAFILGGGLVVKETFLGTEVTPTITKALNSIKDM